MESSGGDNLSVRQWYASRKKAMPLPNEGHLKQPLVDGYAYLGWIKGTTFRLISKLV